MAFKKKVKLTAGMRVKMRDTATGKIVFGTVASVSETEIVIDWDDIDVYCSHTEDEFHLISPA